MIIAYWVLVLLFAINVIWGIVNALTAANLKELFQIYMRRDR